MTTPDFSSPVWQVRALIPDVEMVPNVNDPYGQDAYIFEDAHLQAFIDMNDGNIRLAAADACEALGTSEAYVAKVVKTEDLQTDGAKLMGQFLQRADRLRRQADKEMMEDGEVRFVPYVVPDANKSYWFGSF